jgi:hypothetical protein
MATIVSRNMIMDDDHEKQLSELISQALGKVPDDNKFTSYMKMQGMQGMQGEVGQQRSLGIQGPCGEPGEPGEPGNQGLITRDANYAIYNKIPASAIEDAVIEILKKRGLFSSEEDVVIDSGLKIKDVKTFTLDEIITTIDSMEKRLDVNRYGLWDNTTEHLIDKEKLIEKFKSL